MHYIINFEFIKKEMNKYGYLLNNNEKNKEVNLDNNKKIITFNNESNRKHKIYLKYRIIYLIIIYLMINIAMLKPFLIIHLNKFQIMKMY